MTLDLTTKDGRNQCWTARDLFWQCLENNGEDANKCKREREKYEADCSKTWVKHFDRRREYLKFRKAVESGESDVFKNYKKVENEK